MRIPRFLLALTIAGATLRCTSRAPTDDAALDRQSSAATCAVEWNATWSQGSGANNWWVEYTISGATVASASLEIVGGGTVTLTKQWNKWVGSTARIDTGRSVVVHAVDTAGRRTQTEPFGYLSVTSPKTATCAAPDAGTCDAWDPTWKQESGANDWWVEYAIGGGTVTSASLEVVGGITVALTQQWGKWTGSASARIPSGTSVVVRATSASGQTARTSPFPYLVTTAPETEPCTPPPPPPPPPGGDPTVPDTFAAGETDVVSLVTTSLDRRPISPLLYGVNAATLSGVNAIPADVLRGVTFVRRGGDRANAYNWETNVSNGSYSNGFANDMYLASGLASPNAPGELDRAIIAQNRAAGRGTMVPFVMNGYVAGPVGGNIPYKTAGWNINQYFRRVELVKPTAFAATPNLSDGVVYTDEHIDFLNRAVGGNMFAPGPSQVMVGTDNEPDLFAYNFPMVQRGGGRTLYVDGVAVGTQVTGTEFTAKFVRFAKRVKSLWPTAPIVGPDHYHYDGFTTWWDSMPEYSDQGRWYMDDFLATVRAESEASGVRLLDTWDFHWYPQRVFNGTYTWALDNAARTMTAAEIDAVVQGPRSYWDTTFDEQSWITRDHLFGPATIITRLQSRIAAGYPGTKLGVTEYFPGGCAHVSSALAVADTLGVFARMGVHAAAMWPHSCDLRYAYGGFRLVRDADGAGARFAATNVRVEHPERAPSSLFAASDDTSTVTVLVVNKTNATRRFGVRISNAKSLGTVDAYRVDTAHPSPFLAARATVTKNNAYLYSAPAMSATLLVFRAR